MVHRKATEYLRAKHKPNKNIRAESTSASCNDNKSSSSQNTHQDCENSSQVNQSTTAPTDISRNVSLTTTSVSGVEITEEDKRKVLANTTVGQPDNSKGKFTDCSNKNANEIRKRAKKTDSNKTKSRGLNAKTSEIQITMAMLTVSVLLLLSFTPYFISSIYIQYMLTNESALNPAALFMIRCAFINSVLNCFVYYIFSQAYRVYVKNLFCKFCEKIYA